MIQFLKDRMSSVSSDLYEKILKPNKSNTNHIIKTVPCKAALCNISETLKLLTQHSDHMHRTYGLSVAITICSPCFKLKCSSH